MKRIFLSLIGLLLTVITFAQSFNIATYNLRYDNKGDVGNLWADRKSVVANLIRFHQFDVFGIQEGLKNQLEDLSAALPEYARYGKGRDDGQDAGEHSAIFFRKDRFKLLKSGDFWLSETPDVPGKGWDATCCNRICSWVQLLDNQSKKTFFLFNVHYDHQGVVARAESSKLILRKISEIAGKSPALLSGDLNGGRDSECYQIIQKSAILKDTYNAVKYPYANNSSFNAYRAPNNDTVIDHIFGTPHFFVSRWGILTDTYYGKYPSDHFPVMATVRIQ